MKTFLFIVLMIAIGIHASAQYYYKTERYPIAPAQVLLDQYHPFSLNETPATSENLPSFDVQNPYTYLQVIADDNGKKYHLLMQSDFFGKLLYVAYSENMNGLFKKERGDVLRVSHCMIKKKQESAESMEAIVDCILETINAMNAE
jgi:hypothetical protein